MKTINFDHLRDNIKVDHPTGERDPLVQQVADRKINRARNAREALIEDIVEKCRCRSDKERAALARRIAIWANTTGADETDLHALLKKAQDPTLRNYGKFVNWTIKIRKAM